MMPLKSSSGWLGGSLKWKFCRRCTKRRNNSALAILSARQARLPETDITNHLLSYLVCRSYPSNWPIYRPFWYKSFIPFVIDSNTRVIRPPVNASTLSLSNSQILVSYTISGGILIQVLFYWSTKMLFHSMNGDKN